MNKYFDYYEEVNFKDDVQTINDDGFSKLTDMLEELFNEILDDEDGRSLLNADDFDDLRINIMRITERVINSNYMINLKNRKGKK